MIQIHRHKGSDSPRIDAKDLTGPIVITTDIQVSARNVQPSVIQRGNYTLGSGSAFITFAQQYNETIQLQVLLTSDSANQQFLQGIVVSGFTVSGSGSDTGNWMSIGYK